MLVDKHQSFLQIDFNTLGIKDAHKVLLSFLLSMIKHSQSTQSNTFAISLQYLKKKLGREFIFCMQMNSWDYYFWWKWPDMSKVPKKEIGNIFAKIVAALWGSSHVYYYILVSLHRHTRNFLPKDRNTIIKVHLYGEGLPSFFSLLQVDVFQ